jgi:hypothetical protein
MDLSVQNGEGLSELDLESTEIDDVKDQIPHVQKSLETVGQKETFKKNMGM